ncbi:MAG TPA: HEAT repeat domain-containing protein [Phycisphaerae bacterium]|nr:HEAT repeat domain-containing protein [Phycisphaerae bacterium]
MDVAKYIAHYIEELRQGGGADYCLTEAAETAVPLLVAAMKAETEPDVRRGLVYAIWQYRLPSTAPFLADLLEDRDDEVRQQALDGLITLGTPEARRAIEAALARCRNRPEEQGDFAKYLAEAIELMDEREEFSGEIHDEGLKEREERK